MEKTVKVAVPVLLNRLFDYRVEISEQNSPLIGRRVIVPFGRTNRKLAGVILAENESGDSVSGLKYVEQFLDSEPFFLKENIEFLKWISEYYLTPIGEVFRAAQPAVMKSSSSFVVKANRISEEEFSALEKFSSQLAGIYSFIDERSNRSCPRSSIEKEFGKNAFNLIKKYSEEIDKTIYFNIIEEIPHETKRSSEIKCIRIFPDFLSDAPMFKFELAKLESKNPKRAMVLNLFNANNPHNNFVPLKDFSEKFGLKPDLILRMAENGYFEIEMREKAASGSEFRLATKKEIDLELTEEQNSVYKSLEKKFETQNLKPSLLFGITGSGKTLVYMHLIKKILASGKSVIMILPEISLTPQLTDRFELSFPGEVAVFHSRMTLTEKSDSLKGVLSGRKRIVLGARSALFAPCRNLGLIIVDEEHDRSFKQQSPRPRYNARDCAVVRAYFEKAQILLGSATPSLESMYNAETGKYDLFKISDRADGAVLPAIKIIDMISARKTGQYYHDLSFDLLENIRKRLERKEGIILFQNRRGYAPFLQCEDCGDIHGCPNCSVNLTYHKDREELVCHYCGYSEKAVKYCTNCGSVKIAVRGSGTQMIEEELHDYFSEFPRAVKVERLDADSTSKKGDYRKILKRFATGETDILVGTQMVAKGIDFDRVSLVGIVNADAQLIYPDFRSSENAFQLMTQVSGRAGRTSGISGEVYIQTSRSEDFTIAAVQRGDYPGFYKNELTIRSEAGFPPFSRFCVVEFSAVDRNAVIAHSEIFFKLLNKPQNPVIYEPTAPVIEKMCERFRRIIAIKDMKAQDPTGAVLRNILQNAAAEYYEKYASPEVRLSIDIDA